MLLKKHTSSEEEKLTEFDIWITPSLGDIRDIEEFQLILNKLEDGFNSLAKYTDGFSTEETCSAYYLSKKIIENISSINDVQNHLFNLINAIFLATGKTDNNIKCQFPIKLHSVFPLGKIPEYKNGKLTEINIPRDFNMEKVIKLFSSLVNAPEQLALLLKTYLDILLSDKPYEMQLYTLGKSYKVLSSHGQGINLISTVAIFQSRGSITAKTGHLPEQILRSYMIDWGMLGDADFNLEDVDINDYLHIAKDKSEKSRKYDFVLPYKSKGHGQKLFIQSQFYAGDSGSVSHKAVDQTDASRENTVKKYPQAVFVEYLDGAGYYSSLNGDLKKMLSKKTTKSFFQIKTAPIKLRRELQEIDYITPIEVEHAILVGNKTEKAIEIFLSKQGYSHEEVKRCLSICKKEKVVGQKSGLFSISKSRKDIVVKYFLLDCICNFGHDVDISTEKGILFVPGFTKFWGLSQVELLKKYKISFPEVRISTETLLNAIQWLIDQGFIYLK